MSSYTGITIGPIIDTLMLAHSPAAMWYASYMFSELTEKICSKIDDKSKILSPCYDGAKSPDGIGKYPDRIILRDVTLEDAERIVEESKAEIAEQVAADIDKAGDKEVTEFVKGYLQVHTVFFPELGENENPILALGEKLSVLELMTSPNPDNTNNPFIKLFKGENFKNEYVKKRIEKIAEDSQLKRGGVLRSIPGIASEKSSEDREMKREFYYAVVEADGDRMGKYIETLDTGELGAFSKRCYDRAQASADMIGKYGGMTVYAAGDDLLFLAPVYNGNSNMGAKNIFELCNALAEEFKKNIKDAVKESGVSPTLSFGISVRREGFPLYESLNSAFSALLKAKDDKKGRDAMCVDFEKGSGQSIKMLLSFDDFKYFDNILKLYADAPEDVLKSAIYALENSKQLFLLALEDTQKAENVINNTFDNIDQKKYKKFLDDFKEYFKDFASGSSKIYNENADNTQLSPEENKLKVFENMLRLSKFMLEKKGDK